MKPDTSCDATEKDGGLLVLHSTPRFGHADAKAGAGGIRGVVVVIAVAVAAVVACVINSFCCEPFDPGH